MAKEWWGEGKEGSGRKKERSERDSEGCFDAKQEARHL